MLRARSLTRRRFQGLLAGTTASSLAGAPPVRIGLQLYSVRNQCEQDLPGTLHDIASIGYQAVEFAGYYGHQAPELNRFLKSFGLRCCGAHVSIEELLGERLAATIRFHQVLGNRTLVVPGLPDSYVNSRAAWLRTTGLFANLSARLHQQGIRLGYHNHASEFRNLEGERPWDTFFGNTSPQVEIQLDVGNAGFGGADPIAEIKRYPGRVKSIHVKDYSPEHADLLIGEGRIDWSRLIHTARRTGGTEWFIIEHETLPDTALDEISRSLRRLKMLAANA
jgi:sugar phosphate isomerase/epimerase